MSTSFPPRCPCGCGKIDHNAFKPTGTCVFTPPAEPIGPSQRPSRRPTDTAADQLDIDHALTVTIGQFRALALSRGWSEDWLVEQCRDDMEEARSIVRELLSGHGPTKPWFTGESGRAAQKSLADTPLVWSPLLDLYAHYHGLCVECDGPLQTPEASYCSPRCRKRASRRTPKRAQTPKISSSTPV
jgi:hypothetical protein